VFVRRVILTLRTSIRAVHVAVARRITIGTQVTESRVQTIVAKFFVQESARETERTNEVVKRRINRLEGNVVRVLTTAVKSRNGRVAISAAERNCSVRIDAFLNCRVPEERTGQAKL